MGLRHLSRGIMKGGSEVAYLGSFLGLLAFLQAIIPREIWYALQEWVRRLFLWISFYSRVDVYELDDNHSNEIYEAVKLHVASITTDEHGSARRLTVSKVKGAMKPSFRPATNEKVVDTFQGVQFWWVHRVKQMQPRGSPYWGQSRSEERRYYTLTLHRRYRQSLLPAYLDYIATNAKELDRRNRARKLYTNAQGDGRRLWECVPFKHPSTFKSIAIDKELKKRIIDDLNAFKLGQSFYDRVGRAWKRGYLLHGPPGTGKSSLIAAIANFTDYDVYDLELTEVKSNAELRRLLTSVKNKSVIVIEDIDCSLELQIRAQLPKDAAPDCGAEDEATASAHQRKKKEREDKERSRVTLSGVLNFTDGLWSAIGDERILIFTTNHLDQLDPALLRSGRMDFHILMTYCSFQAFKVLASTYLLLDEHDLFSEIEELLGKVQITPADIAEVFIQNKNNPDIALKKLITELKAKTGG